MLDRQVHEEVAVAGEGSAEREGDGQNDGDADADEDVLLGGFAGLVVFGGVEQRHPILL
jgi:hypothetical protein